MNETSMVMVKTKKPMYSRQHLQRTLLSEELSEAEEQEDDEDSEYDGAASLEVCNVNRKASDGEVVAQAFLVGLGKASKIGSTPISLFSISAESTAVNVNQLLTSNLHAKAEFRLAIADIPYGLNKGSWDVKPWGFSKVAGLAEWVRDFATEWANLSDPSSLTFTLVIFCSLE